MLCDRNCSSEFSVLALHSSGKCDDDPADRTGIFFPGKVRAEFIRESGGQFDSAAAEITAKVIEDDPVCEGEIKAGIR